MNDVELKRPGLARRIVAYPLTLIVIGFVMVLVAAAIGSELTRPFEVSRNSPGVALGALVSAIAVVLAYKAFKRWVEREPDAELPGHSAPAELFAGLAGGFALFSTAVAITGLLGGFEVLRVRGMVGLWPMVAMAITSGTFEEVLFRGLFLRLLERLVGTWIALAITAAFFGMAHLMNPNATLFAAFAIALEAGIMLGAAYLLTRRLWLAIGIHAGWNFTQGWVFGVPVSGGAAPIGLLVTRRVGPDWLTGGEFGLEASVIALIVATTAGLVLLHFARRQAPFVPPRWRRQTKL